MPLRGINERDTDRELPATDRVMMDIVQATAEMTAPEKRVMFHIDPGRPAYNWDRESRSPLSVSHPTKIKDPHGGINTQVTRDAMMREPKSERVYLISEHTDETSA